jgi:hypothetical protein
MKRLLVPALFVLILAGCNDSDVVSSDSSTTSAAVAGESTTSTAVDGTSTTSSVETTTTAVASSSTTTAMDASSTTQDATQTTVKGASTSKPPTPSSSSAATTGKIVLSDEGVGVAKYGTNRTQAEAAITAVLGKPTNTDVSQTCFGEFVTISWGDGFWVEFVRDELFSWTITSGDIDGPNGVNVGDPARHLVAAFDDYKASSSMNELSGGAGMTLTNAKNEVWFRADLSDLPQDDPDATLTTIDGEWGSAEKRLFTVIDDDPNLFCGD